MAASDGASNATEQRRLNRDGIQAILRSEAASPWWHLEDKEVITVALKINFPMARHRC